MNVCDIIRLRIVAIQFPVHLDIEHCLHICTLLKIPFVKL